MIEENKFKNLSILAFSLFLIVLAVIILKPIIIPVILGLLLAYIFYPIYNFVLKIVREKNTSALIIIILILFAFFIPAWFLLPILVKQIFSTYFFLSKIDIGEFISENLPQFAQTDIAKEFVASTSNALSNLSNKVLGFVSKAFLDLPVLLLKGVVFFFVFFFGMRDGKALKEYILSLSPFPPKVENKLTKKFKDMTNSIIFGFIIVGILQGVLTGIGLFIFQVPRALLLTVVAIFTAIIPVLGAWVIWIPAVIYLFLAGKSVSAIILLIYCATIVSWVDNILRPYIVSRKTKVPTGIVVVGMIGGLIAFGITGIIIGPLVLAYILVIIDAYRSKELIFYAKNKNLSK